MPTMPTLGTPAADAGPSPYDMGAVQAQLLQAHQRQQLAQMLLQQGYVPNSKALGALAQIVGAWKAGKIDKEAGQTVTDALKRKFEIEQQQQREAAQAAEQEHQRSRSEKRQDMDYAASLREGQPVMDARGNYFTIKNGRAIPVQIGSGGPATPSAPAPGGANAVQFDFAPGTSPEVEAATRAAAGVLNPGAQEVSGMGGGGGGGGQQLQGRVPAAASGPAPSELERRVALARQMGASEDQIRAMVVGGGQTGNAQTVKTSQATNAKLAQFHTVGRQIDRLEQAAESISKNRVFDGGPLDQYAIKYTPQGQELEQAGAAIMPVLTALTRVPGVGSQSDLEARLAALQLPSAALPPEVNKRAVQSLREYMADLQAAYQSQGASAQPQQAQPHNIDALLEKYK